ncbi:hypothetical protein B0H15DRAFT_868189 [Mycena belliarum]|uniref:Uncharacterized protein n=1 Tax=Mycena belliarum TaxID=1033014 RepID=A0AAD6TTE3_9AGAR|nr:hypothetical protein B0H15DRAFT_868189 [Mycena belliae]
MSLPAASSSHSSRSSVTRGSSPMQWRTTYHHSNQYTDQYSPEAELPNYLDRPARRATAEPFRRPYQPAGLDNFELQNIIAHAGPEQLKNNPYYNTLQQDILSLTIQNNTLQSAYLTLATSIPQIFTLIPNPMGITVANTNQLVSDAPKSAAHIHLLKQDDFPDVRWWTQKEWRRHQSASDDHVSFERSGNHSDDSEDDDEKPNVLGFLEQHDGTPFTPDEIDYARQCARLEFQSLLQRKLAPITWSQSSAEVTNNFRRNMIAQIPALNYGKNYWKVDAVGTNVYAQWARYRKNDLKDSTTKLTSEKKRKRKQTKVGEKASKRVKNIDVTLATSSSSVSTPATSALPPDLDDLIAVPAWKDSVGQSEAAYDDPVFPNTDDSSDNLIGTPPPESTLNPTSGGLPAVPSITFTLVPGAQLALDECTLPETPSLSEPVVADLPIPLLLSADISPILRPAQWQGDSSPPPGPILTGTTRSPLDGMFGDITPVPSPRLAAVEQEQESRRNEASGHSSRNSSKQPRTKRKDGGTSTKHKPGEPHTIWNVFGRHFCAQESEKKNPAPTTAQVRDAFDKITESEKESFKVEAARLKQAEKDRNAAVTVAATTASTSESHLESTDTTG